MREYTVEELKALIDFNNFPNQIMVGRTGNVIKTCVRIHKNGSPQIEMKLDDFMAMLLQEVPRIETDFKKEVGNMWKVMSKATTDQRVDEAFQKVNIEGRIMAIFAAAVKRMKQDSAYQANHIR